MKKTVRILDTLLLLVTGCVFLYGVYVSLMQEDGTLDYAVLSTLECILMLYGGIFCLLSFLYQRKRKTGACIPVLRCSVYLSVMAWCLYGLIFLKGHYGLYPSSLQEGVKIFRLGTVCLLVEWLLSEKGHFWKQFTWSGMILFVIYCVVALVAGYTGHGIGLNGHVYPYPFLDVDMLGWQIVIPNIILVLSEIWVFDRLWIFVDQSLRRREKNHGKKV